jgi:TatD DNase family protein
VDLIDSHAHLDFSQFDDDRDAMLNRARQAGVGTLLAVGIGNGPDQMRAAIPYAESRNWIFATTGIHPCEARLATDAHFAELEALTRHPRVIAVGEIGLDYFHKDSPADVQDRVFRRQLEIARASKLPVVIHCRNAWDDCLGVLEQDWKSTGLGGILHCFSGTEQEARRGLDMNFLVSFAGNVTYPKSQALRDIAARLPLDRILIETDSPFLAPEGRRGKRNEPAFVAEVAHMLGNVRNLAADEIARATSGNFRRFFPLAAAKMAGPA